MTSTQITTTKAKTNHYFRALVALAALAMMAMLLMAKPTHATTTFTVNFNGDFADLNVGDGICDVTTSTGEVCTLRAAIQESNATFGGDTINFDIPEAFRDPNTGVATISPNSGLPAITDKVIIDGYTQPDSSPNTLAKGTNAVLKIELNGANSGVPTPADGLKFTFDGSNSTVKGLVINRFGLLGVRIAGAAVRIEGNFIGTDPSGTVDLGNFSQGVGIFSETGTTTTDNVVGGTTLAARNLISGNDSVGVGINAGSTGIKVLGNLVGTKKDGTTALANASTGVFITDGANNTVSGNTIAFNARDGVSIDDAGSLVINATGNSVLRNSIFSNGELGIDLGIDGPNTNDLGDGDTGANNLQNKPVISSAKTLSGTTTINGKLNSTANKTYTIQLFSNPSGTNEGKKFIGQKSITTDGSGNRSFTFSPAKSVAAGQTITATATRASTHDTSEFSAPRTVAST
jgi:parallel beta-helix repeat protein